MNASKYKTKPYRHQLDCLNKFGRREAFALLAEMGTGKTWIIINNVADLWASGDCDGMLVLAPNGVHSNWTRLELPTHMPDWVRYRSAAWYASPRKDDAKALNELYADAGSGELRILTMNWEAIQSKRGADEAHRFASCFRRLMIVADESDAIKNPTARRTKALMRLRHYSHWRRIMTGTPINNAPFDLFSQFAFLDETILQTSSFYAFKAEYADLLPAHSPLMRHISRGSRFKPQIVQKDKSGKKMWRNLDKLSALIAPHSFRVLKSECLDLPEKIYKTLHFDLTREQTAAYKKMEEECRVLMADGAETIFNKLVAVSKLAQITSGYCITPEGSEPLRIDGGNPKLDLLVERVAAIADEGNKVIVWARYRIEIADIVARLEAEGHTVVQYHGGVNKEDRTAAIEAFERGDANVFVGNQQAGGTGITLVAASYVIYFSNNFSLRDRLQSEDRAHRIGQTRAVTYINIAARGTIDETVVWALINKKDVAETIINKGLAP